VISCCSSTKEEDEACDVYPDAEFDNASVSLHLDLSTFRNSVFIEGSGLLVPLRL
jgi:hypothetical protein